MLVPQDLQRTVLPRADAGTASTFRQVRLGHMMRTASIPCPRRLGAPGSGKPEAGPTLAWADLTRARLRAG